MKPLQVLEKAVGSNGAEYELHEHDGDYYLLCDRQVISSTYAQGSEYSLATLACKPLRPSRQPAILIAGLELGITLAAARENLPQKRAQFLVVEPLAALAEWHKKHLADLHPKQLTDSRVQILPEDLADALQKLPEGTLSAVILGGDCTPPRPDSRTYSLANQALKPGGLLAIRYTYNAPSPLKLLRKTGFEVAYEQVPAKHKGKAKQQHTIWLAHKGRYQRHH